MFGSSNLSFLLKGLNLLLPNFDSKFKIFFQDALFLDFREFFDMLCNTVSKNDIRYDIFVMKMWPSEWTSIMFFKPFLDDWSLICDSVCSDHRVLHDLCTDWTPELLRDFILYFWFLHILISDWLYWLEFFINRDFL